MDNQQLTTSENQQRPLPCSTLATIRSDLQPATTKAGTAELMACLTLVAPSGMSAEDRRAWVAVAKSTLTGIPADLLAFGCKKARETCRFASEIVPLIIEEVSGTWEWRKQQARTEYWRLQNIAAPRLEKPIYPPIPHEETQRIIREARESLTR